MVRRVVILGVVLAFLGPPAVASAQGYTPPPGPGPCGDFLDVSDDTLVPGQAFAVIGACYRGTVNVTINSHTTIGLGTAVADPSGTFVLRSALPCPFEPGAHTISATGQDFDGGGSLTQSVPVTVINDQSACAPGAKKPAAQGPLARTGGDSIGLAQVGVILVLVGAGMALTVHKRRSSRASEGDAAA